jgi:NADPH:quinone reductase-like Zn-dependent oxidoreductase
MKAILCTAYGDADMLKLVEIEKPTPRPNEVLVRIYASTVTFGDCEIRNLTLPAWTRFPVRLIMGYRKPKWLIPGMEASGVIEAVGSKVSEWKPGDAIFGSTGMNMGGNAEYLCRPIRIAAAKKPADVSFEDVVTIPVGGINALHFLRMANIQPQQNVLIIGAGGSIGTWGVHLAKYWGANVTAIDHADKLNILKSIGADHVIDYMKEDFSLQGKKYDVIFDIVYKSSFSKCINTLTNDGYYLMANTSPGRMLKGLWVEWTTRKKVRFALAKETTTDLSYLASLIATKKIKPVIDRVYPLEQTIEAHRYVEQGLKKGNVIVRIKTKEE